MELRRNRIENIFLGKKRGYKWKMSFVFTIKRAGVHSKQ